MSTPKKFEPFIPDSVAMREFTLRAVLTGAVLGLIFGASSLYLVLKVGLTVSASIPVAVISLSLFRSLGSLWVRVALYLVTTLSAFLLARYLGLNFIWSTLIGGVVL